MSDKTKNGLKITAFIICIISLFLDLWLLYYHMFLKDNFTLTTAYVDDMEYSDDEKYFIEAQYYPNMFEVKLNYYTDVSIPEYDEESQSYGDKYTYSSGVQFDGGYQAEIKGRKTGFIGAGTYYRYNELINCEYYNTTDSGDSYGAVNELSNQNKWVYDIGGKLALIKEKGNSKYGSNWLGYGKYHYYGTALMLEDLYNAITSLEDGVRVVTFDLSQYYTFTLFNEDTNKFEEEVHETTETWMFINVKVEKYSTDFVSAEQSMFGKFMNDPNWSLYDLEQAEYWRARHELNLGIENFTFVYENKGYYLKLRQSVIDFLSEFKNMQYIVTIDLDSIYLGSEKIQVEGFAEKPFGSLGIDTINLTSAETREFRIYDSYNIVCPGNITIVKLEVQNG